MPSLFKRIKNFFTGRRNEPKRTQSPKTEGSGISGKDEVLNNEVVIVAELPPPPTEIVAPFEEEELIPQSSPSPTPEAISTVPTTLPPLDDALSRAIYEAVSDTWSGLKDNFESSSTAKNFGFRVIAAFVAVDERQFVQPMVLSIGTGSKWLSGKHLALDGGTVHDCHAEIIALRALRRLLIEQLQAIGEGRPVTPSLLEPRSDAAAASAQNGPHFRLKSGLKLYLYISRPPCGDAQCWRYFADSAGRLRVKLRATGGSTHQALPSSSSCPTVADFNRLKTGGGTATFMSCSDKVLLWNVVGLQGALLSALVEPVYLSGVVVSDYHGPGGLTLQQTLQRALHGRVDAAQLAAKLQQSSSSSSSSSPPLFALNRPLISFAEPYDHQDQFQFSPKKFDRPISLNWFRPPLVHSSSCRSNEVELINTESGRLYEVAAAGEGGGDSPSTTPPSRLCKRALLDSYRQLLVAAKNLSSPSGASSSSSSSGSGTVKEKLLSDRLSGTYLELKQRSAPSYMAAKWALKETLAGQGLGRWRSAPAHVDLFTVQS